TRRLSPLVLSLSLVVSLPSTRVFFFLMTPPPPRSTLFPYTTLFRSTWCLPPPTPPVSSPSGCASRCRWSARRWTPSPSPGWPSRSEEHTSELQSLTNLVCRLLLEKKKKHNTPAEKLLIPPVRDRTLH